MNGIIEVDNLTFGYTPRNTVLRDISLAVMPGEFLAIAGPNGAGKTTLLNLLCRTLTPKSGTIRIDSVPVESYGAEALAEKMAVVRQEFVPIFGFSVIETVMMARTRHFGAMGFESKTDREIVNRALDVTDSAKFASRPLPSLSAGERQRVFIARALAQDTAILLLDEPTSFLDLKHQVAIFDLLKSAQLNENKTLVAVTHDINLATQYCDRTLLLGTDGSYRHGQPGEILSPEQIEKVFGVPVFAGQVGRGRFFIPLGKFARDAEQATNAADDATQQ